MKLRSMLAAVGLLVSSSSLALAAAATPEEATRLTGVFQSYLGQEPGVVTVTASGDAYDLKIDLAPLIKKNAQPGLVAEFTPIAMKLMDQGSGKWQVTQDQPFSFKVSNAGQFDISGKAGIKMTGVFDQNLMAFATSVTDFNELTFDENILAPAPNAMHVTYLTKNMHYETTATGAGADTVDSKSHVTTAEISESLNFPSPPTGMPLALTIKVENVTQDTTITGMKIKAIYPLIAWFVSHPSEAAIKANQAELKTLLQSALPGFANLTTTASMQNLSVVSPMGPIVASKLSGSVHANGVVSDGMFGEGIKIEGLSLPPGLVPAWASDLMPHAFSLDFKVDQFDLAAPTKLLLDKMDLANPVPNTPEDDALLLRALLPKGSVNVTIGPNAVTAQSFVLNYQGAVMAGPFGMPAGIANISATGFEKVMKALTSAPPEMGGQFIQMLIGAKGLAKTESDGSMSWKIENTPTGGVLVNGVDVSKMGAP